MGKTYVRLAAFCFIIVATVFFVMSDLSWREQVNITIIKGTVPRDFYPTM